MATSSITANFAIRDADEAKRFVDAYLSTDRSSVDALDISFARYCGARRAGNAKPQMSSQTLPHYHQFTSLAVSEGNFGTIRGDW